MDKETLIVGDDEYPDIVIEYLTRPELNKYAPPIKKAPHPTLKDAIRKSKKRK